MPRSNPDHPTRNSPCSQPISAVSFSYILIMVIATGSAASAYEQEVDITTLNGQSIRGKLQHSETENSITLITDIRTQTIPTSELLTIRFQNTPMPTDSNESWPVTIWDTYGSCFSAKVLSGDSNRLQLQTAFADSVQLRLQELAAIGWNKSASSNLTMSKLDIPAKPGVDQLISQREDGSELVLEGVLEKLTPDGGSFSYQSRKVDFAAQKTRGIVLGNVQKVAPEISLLRTRSGLQLAGNLQNIGSDHVELLLIGQTLVRFPLGNILEIQLNRHRVVYLSDLVPAQQIQQQLFESHWSVRFDRCVTNQPMILAQQVFPKGIGVHARCELTYELHEPFQALLATIGIDDHVRPTGSAIFRILANGQELFKSPILTGKDKPLSIAIPLQAPKNLTLIVDPANDLDLSDHANWADIKLVR